MGTTVHTGSKRGQSFAALLVTTAVTSTYLIPKSSHAQEIFVENTVTFAIEAQPLNAAINSFIRQSGWQVGYAAAVVSGKRSNPVSGKMAPLRALEAMLSGSNVTIRLSGSNAVSLVGASTTEQATDGTTVLETIVVKGARGGVDLGTDRVADTGTSTLHGGQITVRAEGNDANGILRNLPNVQYQNDVDDDAGITAQSVIDLKPREVSISGARVYENNFMINGMEINNVTGSQERYGSEEPSSAEGAAPNADRVFGLHSQTVYVPTDFIEEATVIDSNASAKYGNFQGGVVSYKLMDAQKDRWTTSVTTDYTSSDWTTFNLATKDGLNPNDVAPNDFRKRRSSISVSGPVTDNVSVLGQYSTSTASTEKDKSYRYTENRRVEQDSENKLYRSQMTAETDLGDFTLEGAYTDYTQLFENATWRNMAMDVQTKSLTSKLQHDYEFNDFSLGGVALTNVKLRSKLTYGKSDTINDMNGNVAKAFVQQTTRAVKNGGGIFTSTELSEWCRTDPTKTTTRCYDGATGDKEQGQEQLGWSEELTGDIWNGSFTVGTEYTHTNAYRRRPEDALYYGAYTSLGDVSNTITAFNCNTTEECSSEQFASTKIIYKAFDIKAELNAFNTYAEIDQTWDWLNVRAGARLSYDDYMKNLDVSPRLVATVTPWDDLSVSAGVNRYYNAQSLAFAIRDQQPRAQTYTRGQTGGVVGDTWTSAVITGNYANSASDLNTPYTDEITFGLSGKDPVFDGDWRLRFLDRRSKDQFASQTSGQGRILTNDAHGAYQSATAEYSKEIDVTSIDRLEQLLFNASITWSKSKVSNDSYFEDNFEDDYIWYKGKSYTQAGFAVVTGNMDIPLRLQTGLSSTWLDDSLHVDVSANYNLRYTGAKNTDATIIVDGVSHEIYEDFDFDAALTVDLSADYTVYKKADASLAFNVKVNNLFDETGNATSSTSNPWIIGRTVWVGAKATF